MAEGEIVFDPKDLQKELKSNILECDNLLKNIYELKTSTNPEEDKKNYKKLVKELLIHKIF